MDSKSFEEQIQALSTDIERYKWMIDTYEKLIYNLNYVDTTTLSYQEMMRRVDYAYRNLRFAQKELERLQQKYYSQFPLTKAQYGCVGFPTGITNLDGSDKY